MSFRNKLALASGILIAAIGLIVALGFAVRNQYSFKQAQRESQLMAQAISDARRTRSFHFYGRLDRSAWDELGTIKDLRELRLENSNVDLAELNHFADLQVIYVVNCHVSCSSVIDEHALHIQELRMDSCNLDRSTLAAFRPARNAVLTITAHDDPVVCSDTIDALCKLSNASQIILYGFTSDDLKRARNCHPMAIAPVVQ